MSQAHYHGHGHLVPHQFYSNYPGHYYNSRVALSSGLFGGLVGFTLTMGFNLHKVQSQKMTLMEATVDSIVKGGMAGVASFAGTSVAQLTGMRGILPVVFMIATATGVNYLMSYVGKPKVTTEKNLVEGEK